MVQHIYHVTLGKKRTTISVDCILSELLALRLGFEPDTPEAHTAVRGWIEGTLIDKIGRPRWGRQSASQWSRFYLIEEVADKRLCRKRLEWLMKQE